jgi:opacity protein-like surface antigen
MRHAAALVASLVISLAVDAHAQVTVGGVAGASHQDAGASDLPYLGPGFGGTSLSLIGLVDVPLMRRLTWGGEGSLATAISGDQSQRAAPNTRAFTSRHRDSVFSGTLKLGTMIGPVHAAVMGGAGTAYRRTSREGTTASIFPPTQREPYADSVSDFVFAYTIGGDVDVRLTSRMRVLALVRWHRLQDDDRQSDGTVRRGVSSKVLRAGIGIKWQLKG